MSAPNETTQTFKGTVSGVITTERQGEHGFVMILFSMCLKR